MSTTIPGWNYEQPTEETMLGELASALGGDENAVAAFEMACRRLGQRRPVADPDDLIRVSETLQELGDLLRVTARSAKIRVSTYQALRAAYAPR
ncbi:hypothetical protein [Actinoplanes teichomyceticus]|uniref:Uncharacterized protein n=1 Tax=Actinoplanes teichomyceticus TaxID=1867 RepID=A0A561VIA4_ACTTI|nr:hypothetical protein [Actinoplanes teichomyceticus]TWG11348.1 hypothetical protein FHX34_10678 [Actinoplanes teichomyceticus]GIF16382.1 hypothetical protein Ate01nite_64140 [Actinoplanes teichomyceticus]